MNKFLVKNIGKYLINSAKSSKIVITNPNIQINFMFATTIDPNNAKGSFANKTPYDSHIKEQIEKQNENKKQGKDKIDWVYQAPQNKKYMDQSQVKSNPYEKKDQHISRNVWQNQDLKEDHHDYSKDHLKRKPYDKQLDQQLHRQNYYECFSGQHQALKNYYKFKNQLDDKTQSRDQKQYVKRTEKEEGKNKDSSNDNDAYPPKKQN